MIVSEKALISRINRRLAHGGTVLKKTRGQRWRSSVGDFYEIDGNTIVSTHVDLEDWARELGVLRPSERLAA